MISSIRRVDDENEVLLHWVRVAALTTEVYGISRHAPAATAATAATAASAGAATAATGGVAGNSGHGLLAAGTPVPATHAPPPTRRTPHDETLRR